MPSTAFLNKIQLKTTVLKHFILIEVLETTQFRRILCIFAMPSTAFLSKIQLKTVVLKHFSGESLGVMSNTFR